jgi:hypothetical protein
VRPGQNYFIAPLGIAMSELKMSHSVSHFPSTFFDDSIHLPWSKGTVRARGLIRPEAIADIAAAFSYTS